MLSGSACVHLMDVMSVLVCVCEAQRYEGCTFTSNYSALAINRERLLSTLKVANSHPGILVSMVSVVSSSWLMLSEMSETEQCVNQSLCCVCYVSI